MWEHPITSKQVATLKEWGYHEVPCISKTLVCGDKGLGAMAEVVTIVDTVVRLKSQKSMQCFMEQK
jgi:phosphopantothenoylcysteine decarboxylase